MKLSIITINLNNAEGLRKTIVSVVSQTFTDYEFIVIDGGSTDGSVEVIKQYADRISYWVSEPDRGVFHAMNKGIMQAKGDYCQFLNSGDWLIEPNGLQYVFEQNPVEDIVYCDEQTENGPRIYADKLTYFIFFMESITHQAAFIKRVLFSTFGLYNEEHKIVSDWEFYLKTLFKAQCTYRHIPYFLVFFDDTGMSENPEFQKIHDAEREKVLKKEYPMMYDDYQELLMLKKEISIQNRSRLIQFVRQIQSSGFYQRIRRLSFRR